MYFCRLYGIGRHVSREFAIKDKERKQLTNYVQDTYLWRTSYRRHRKDGDIGRLGAQVISGIGFLGAGAIIKTKSSIRGLTTAAGIWVAAGIGLAVGIGLYAIAIIAMILILLTLVTLDYYEHRFKFEWESNIIRLKLPIILSSIDEYSTFFRENNIRLHEWYINYDYAETTTTIDFIVQVRGNSDIAQILTRLSTIHPTTNISLQNEIS